MSRGLGTMRKRREAEPSGQHPDEAIPGAVPSFVMHENSAKFSWASTEHGPGIRTDRLLEAMLKGLGEHGAATLGVMMPTWVALHPGTNHYGLRTIDQSALATLSWTLSALRTQLPDLRTFVSWKVFVSAAAPKIYLWEAFKPATAAEINLPAMLASFRTATTSRHHDAVVPTEEVLSVLGALLVRLDLTTDLTVLTTPCVMVGRPATKPDRAIRNERDKEFLDYLIRAAIRHCLKANGQHAIADLYMDATPEKDLPKRGRRSRTSSDAANQGRASANPMK